MKSISVVIPNYNGKDLLNRNLPEVYRALSSSGIQDFEIIVADDASTDNSIEFLSTEYPEVIQVKNKHNKGFAGNVNSGINAASKELVMILNSDVQLTENYFSPLLSHFDQNDTFGVSGRILSLDGKELQDAAKYPGYSYGNIVATTNYEATNRTSLLTFFMSGANALVNREKLLQVGSFNECFNPYYGEDVDLSLTAWRAGYKVYYAHEAVCMHPNSATISKQSHEIVRLVAKRNKIILHYLHLSGAELQYFMFLTYIKAIARLLVFGTVHFKALQAFNQIRNDVHVSKKNLVKLRCKSVKDVVSYIMEDIGDTDIRKF